METDHGKGAVRPVRRPRRRLPEVLRARRPAEDRPLSWRPDGPEPERYRLYARSASRQCLRRPRIAKVPGRSWAHAGRHIGQGGRGLGLRPRTHRRGRRHFPAVLARLSHRRAHRQGAESETGDHRRNRLRPRRSRRGRRERHHGRRGHVFQQHQRGRTRRDDDPLAGAQLSPLLQMGAGRRLEHRRLREPLLRPRGNARRNRRRRAHRTRRSSPSQAVRRTSPLHRPASPSRIRRAGTRPHLP